MQRFDRSSVRTQPASDVDHVEGTVCLWDGSTRPCMPSWSCAPTVPSCVRPRWWSVKSRHRVPCDPRGNLRRAMVDTIRQIEKESTCRILRYLSAPGDDGVVEVCRRFRDRTPGSGTRLCGPRLGGPDPLISASARAVDQGLVHCWPLTAGHIHNSSSGRGDQSTPRWTP